MACTRRRLLTLGCLVLLAAGALAAGGLDDERWGVHPTLADSGEFLDAVRTGDLARVARLLEARPELLDCGDEEGRSAFVVAYLDDQEKVAQLLLSRGYLRDLVDCVLISDWDQVKVLVDEQPARLNEYHPIGGTALYAGARLGRSQLWRLIARGADPDANPRGEQGVTAAFGALECRDPVDAFVTAVNLFTSGADVNAPQRDGWSVLHAAVDRDHPDLVRFFIRRGAVLEARDAQGETPLDLARRRGFDPIIELLTGEAEIPRDTATSRFAYDAQGEPLTLPDLSDVPRIAKENVCRAARGDPVAVRQLLKSEPRLVFVLSSQDELAVEAAARSGRQDIANMLLERGAPQSLATSLAVGDLGRARALLEEEPARIHERGSNDYPLMWFCAIGGGGVEGAELLLEFGADVDQESLGTTALHWAAREDRVELARFLLEHGAMLDPVGYQFSRRGKTPADVARSRKRRDMVQFLEQWDAEGR